MSTKYSSTSLADRSFIVHMFESVYDEDGKQEQGSIYQKNYNGLIYVDNYDISIGNSDGYDLPEGSSSSVIKITKELDKALIFASCNF